VRPSLFRDRIYHGGIVFIAIVAVTTTPPWRSTPHLQNLMNYRLSPPALSWAPRGVATMGAMAGRRQLTGRVDTRLLLGIRPRLTAGRSMR